MVQYTGVSFTTISVYTTSSSGILSAIFADGAGIIPISNPFVSFGNYSFYAATDQYILPGDFTQVIVSPAVLFAGLPGVPTLGMIRTITDASTAVWGAVIAGLGANQVLAWFNGVNWTVIGK